MANSWLSALECDRLLDELHDGWRAARVYDTDRSLIEGTGRKTDVQWLHIEDHWLEERWHRLVMGFAQALDIAVHTEPAARRRESIQMARYQPGHHYNWHSDVDLTGAQELGRKMSITVLLQGDRTIELDPNAGPMPPLFPGDAIAFPSWMQHRVAATEGERYSMVGWITGPRYR